MIDRLSAGRACAVSDSIVAFFEADHRNWQHSASLIPSASEYQTGRQSRDDLLGLSEYLLAAPVAEIHRVDALALHLTVIMRRVDAHGLLHALAARPLFGGSFHRRATR
ncbi:MAG: hypothetical protein KGZ72_00695 [Roseovarius sp.]|uniref:hypothetical protein n=1 Tax=Sphingomonas sp. CCH9-F2 TaxID=1768778 RepID=UPI0012E3BCAE|nr:hypothetical protein [Sphingomonas sp. CCH9-F2]MBS4009251.1 hypothetical protein [Roseovarius sp.]